MIDGYITVKEVAKEWNLSIRTVQIMCAKGKITEVTRFGREWAIPNDVEKACDKRIVTGKYKNWRRTKDNLEGGD